MDDDQVAASWRARMEHERRERLRRYRLGGLMLLGVAVAEVGAIVWLVQR